MTPEDRAREVLADLMADYEKDRAVPISVTGKTPSYYIRDGQGASVPSLIALNAMLQYASEMTHPRGTEPSEVLQSDREAAAVFVRAWDAKYGDRDTDFFPSETDTVLIRDGQADDELVVQAFARYRTEIAQAIHTGMLRGDIAKPSPANIWHLYQRELLDAMPANFRTEIEQRALERAAEVADEQAGEMRRHTGVKFAAGEIVASELANCFRAMARLRSLASTPDSKEG